MNLELCEDYLRQFIDLYLKGFCTFMSQVGV